MTDLLSRPPQIRAGPAGERRSVALDETAREVSERQILPAEGLRERIEQQRPITALRSIVLLLNARNRPIWLIGHRLARAHAATLDSRPVHLEISDARARTSASRCGCGSAVSAGRRFAFAGAAAAPLTAPLGDRGAVVSARRASRVASTTSPSSSPSPSSRELAGRHRQGGGGHLGVTGTSASR